MPTENRSSNTEMVSVPPYIGQEPLVGRYYPARCRSCGWVGSSEELTEDDAQCTRDIGDRLCLGDCDELGRDDLLSIIQAMAKPAEQHQGEPVSLPERKGTHLHYDSLMPTFSKGWNACLDEIAKLGQLYTHADPGEVERCEARLHEVASLCASVEQERDTLRAQLAERDELLRDTKRCIERNDYPVFELLKRIDAALSASAESSAPVERDERAEFEQGYQRAVDHGWSNVKHLARQMWDARAALERNPS